jgi:hypothetical protein
VFGIDFAELGSIIIRLALDFEQNTVNFCKA